MGLNTYNTLFIFCDIFNAIPPDSYKALDRRKRWHTKSNTSLSSPMLWVFIRIVSRQAYQLGHIFQVDYKCFELDQIQYVSIFWGSLPHYPFPKRQILESTKLKVFSFQNFIFDGNGTEFYKD